MRHQAEGRALCVRVMIVGRRNQESRHVIPLSPHFSWAIITLCCDYLCEHSSLPVQYVIVSLESVITLCQESGN